MDMNRYEWLYGSICAYVCTYVYRYPMKLGEKGKMMDFENLRNWWLFGNLGTSSLKPSGQLCFMLQSIKPPVTSAGWPSSSDYKMMRPPVSRNILNFFLEPRMKHPLSFSNFTTACVWGYLDWCFGTHWGPSFCKKRVLIYSHVYGNFAFFKAPWASYPLFQGAGTGLMQEPFSRLLLLSPWLQTRQVLHELDNCICQLPVTSPTNLVGFEVPLLGFRLQGGMPNPPWSLPPRRHRCTCRTWPFSRSVPAAVGSDPWFLQTCPQIPPSWWCGHPHASAAAPEPAGWLVASCSLFQGCCANPAPHMPLLLHFLFQGSGGAGLGLLGVLFQGTGGLIGFLFKDFNLSLKASFLATSSLGVRSGLLWDLLLGPCLPLAVWDSRVFSTFFKAASSSYSFSRISAFFPCREARAFFKASSFSCREAEEVIGGSVMARELHW